MRQKIDQSTARAMNRRLILNLLRENGNLSRSEIAGQIGLSPATVTFAVADLIEEGLLLEGAPSAGAAGRRPIPVGLNYGGLHAVGLKVMADSIECVLTDLSTRPILSWIEPMADHQPATVVESCARAVARVMEQGRVTRVTGVGVAMPGVLKDGHCQISFRFGWRDVPIAQMLADRLRLPVWVEDDTNAFALTQQLYGHGRNGGSFAALAIGVGISCAVVIGGRVHHGAHGAAGKIGHTTYRSDGPPCECGRRGCLQTYFSEPALVQRWRAATGAPAAADRHDLARSAAAGEGPAVEILSEAGQAVGALLAIVCDVIDPEMIVAGGESVVFGEAMFGPMRAALARGMMIPPPEIIPDWAEYSWAQGAAALATRQVFDFQAADAAIGG